MFGEEILQTIKGIGDTALKAVDMFTVSDDEKMSYKLKIQQSQFDSTKEAHEFIFKNLESARRREVDTNDPTVRRLSYVYTAGYFTWHWGIPVDGHDVFVTLLGVLTAAQAAIINYYFGSSHSSASKEKIIDRVVNHKSST
jgi:hypothetical protein